MRYMSGCQTWVARFFMMMFRYGIPGKLAEKFERALRNSFPQRFQEDPDLLHLLVIQAAPSLLLQQGKLGPCNLLQVFLDTHHAKKKIFSVKETTAGVCSARDIVGIVTQNIRMQAALTHGRTVTIFLSSVAIKKFAICKEAWPGLENNQYLLRLCLHLCGTEQAAAKPLNAIQCNSDWNTASHGHKSERMDIADIEVAWKLCMQSIKLGKNKQENTKRTIPAGATRDAPDYIHVRLSLRVIA